MASLMDEADIDSPWTAPRHRICEGMHGFWGVKVITAAAHMKEGPETRWTTSEGVEILS